MKNNKWFIFFGVGLLLSLLTISILLAKDTKRYNDVAVLSYTNGNYYINVCKEGTPYIRIPLNDETIQMYKVIQ